LRSRTTKALRRCAAFLFFAGFAWCRCSGAEKEIEYFARTWTTADGLAHNVVPHILQDRTGYIWLATVGGLSRFDGKDFKEFVLPENLRQRGYSVRGLAEDSEGVLLLLPNGNVVRLANGGFTIHPITSSLVGQSPTELFAEPNGTLWVGAEDGTLLRWKTGAIATFQIDHPVTPFSFAIDGQGRTWIASGSFLAYAENEKLIPVPLAAGKKLAIASARSGRILVLADRRLLEVDEAHATTLIESLALPKNSLVRQILEDHHGALWISTRREGLFRFSQGEVTSVGAASDFTLTVAEDREGDIWVGTEGSGVSMLREKAFSLFDAKAETLKMTNAIAADSEENVWLANRRVGVMRYHAGQVQVIPETAKLRVNTLAPDRRGGMWIGALGGLYHLSSGAAPVVEQLPLSFTDIRTLLCTRNGDLWFSNNSGGLGRLRGGESRMFSAADNYFPERIASLAEDNSGAVWLGTEAGNLWRFADEKFARIAFPPGISLAPIHTLLFDRLDVLWIGTADGLLLRQGKTFRRFTEADGLRDSLIFQMLEDEAGQFWFGSRQGLFSVRRAQLLEVAQGSRRKVFSTNLGPDQGLPNISLRVGGQPLAVKDSRGVLWFTTMQGPIALDPSKVATQSSPPKAFVQSALIDGEEGDLRSLQIPAGRHRLEFRFAALSYAAGEKIRLRYQLEGVDPGWVEAGRERAASYSSLPPGKYRLRVAVEDETGSPSETETRFGFVVLPSWWQTWWVRGGIVVGLLAAAGGGFRRYLRWQVKRQLAAVEQAHALDKERARIARDLHDELGSSLTRIAFGLEELKRRVPAAEARPLFEQLSQRIRRHASDLRRVIWVESPKNDSLDRVVFFIGQFAQDYFRDGPVVCLVRPSREIPSDPIPPEVQHHLVAVAKEAFNNVLKHAQATQVTIEARFERSCFEMMIEDNGVGFVPLAEVDYDHNGLTNMRTRIAEIGGELVVHSQPGHGTTVLIHWLYRSRLPIDRSSRPPLAAPVI
jgi:signal transduction histidine kinase/ligand-binding sensor domain-containing protein